MISTEQSYLKYKFQNTLSILYSRNLYNHVPISLYFQLDYQYINQIQSVNTFASYALKLSGIPILESTAADVSNNLILPNGYLNFCWNENF